MSDTSPITRTALRYYTPARVALGSAGPSIPTREQLLFQLDHAQARDAVHMRLDVLTLRQALSQRKLDSLALHSRADRTSYLRRPDLGRTLHPESAQQLQSLSLALPDAVFVIVDGLSALAVERHGLPLLDATLPLLKGAWQLAPLMIVTQGRVAIGDEIGYLLRAQLTVTLIGERPGLSSPDSLGVYLTWNPKPGRTDAERNCISNIRLEGLSYQDAAQRILYYMNGAKQLQTTGIALKENAALPR